MRGKKAKMLRKMAAAMANPEYKERMYTVRTVEIKRGIKRNTYINAKDSARGIYRRLKNGG